MTNPIHDANVVALEVQDDGVGSGARQILDARTDYLPTLEKLEVSFGAITRGYGINPSTGNPRPNPVRREQPEPLQFELSMRQAAEIYLEKFGRDDRLGFYVRVPSKEPSSPLDYVKVFAMGGVAIEGFTYNGLASGEPTTDLTDVTVSLNAASIVRIWPVTGYQLSTGLTKLASVNITDGAIDSDGNIYFVTAKDATSTNPLLVYSTDGGETWTEVELTDLATHDCSAVVVVGSYLLIAADTIIALYDKDGTYNSSYTASGNIAAMAAIDAAKIVAVGASGLVLYSEDGGGTWSSVSTGVTENLVSVAIKDVNTWYIGGANGTFLRYERPSMTAVSVPSAISTATINSIAIPESYAGFPREETVYIAASAGRVYKSDDKGATWEEVIFASSGSGNTAAIGFTELLGQVLWILHHDASGNGVLYRDWSGGAGGATNNVEEISVPTNSGFGALVLQDANTAYIGGNVHSSADMVVKVYR